METPAPVDVSDETLMLRYQRGEMGAFATLVARHEGPLFHFVARHVRSAVAAEDVVRETFVRVIENAGTFKHEARFSTWIYAIARDLSVDRLRGASPRPRDEAKSGAAPDAPTDVEIDLEPASDAPSAEGAAAGSLSARIAAAVDALPEEQREVFLLRQLAGLPFGEIASVTDAPPDTVKSRMRYALERLDESLGEHARSARAPR